MRNSGQVGMEDMQQRVLRRGGWEFGPQNLSQVSDTVVPRGSGVKRESEVAACQTSSNKLVHTHMAVSLAALQG